MLQGSLLGVPEVPLIPGPALPAHHFEMTSKHDFSFLRNARFINTKLKHDMSESGELVKSVHKMV